MTANSVACIPGRRGHDPQAVEVVYLDPEAGETRAPLTHVADVLFERCAPVRPTRSYRGQRSNAGLYYAATTAAHVPFKSWLERDEAMSLDFDPTVEAFAAQPLTLLWSGVDRGRSHTPDFFARRTDGSTVVVDCAPPRPAGVPQASNCTGIEQACTSVGWQYRLVSGHEPIRLANVAWLAGYRHPRHRAEPAATRLLSAFAHPRPLLDGATAVGEPIAVLPVLYHLLWLQQLVVDLSLRLDACSVVGAAVHR